jgi:pimeloyl-ACP methyl ester carboxylesterase
MPVTSDCSMIFHVNIGTTNTATIVIEQREQRIIGLCRLRLLVVSFCAFIPSTVSHSMALNVGHVPPLSPYGTFQGTLFQYASHLVAFESDPSCPHKCILLGGLSDGLIPTPYAKELEQKASGWSLVQPILSSSYLGFGHGDLNRDTQEFAQLLVYLKTHHHAQTVAMIGHSTGCQNSIHFLKHAPDHDHHEDLTALLRIVVLQAPVSDREDAMTRPEYQSNIDCARSLLEQGREDEMMPRSAFWAPITAKRFLDLQDRLGADDFFSSDFTDEELIERLGHVGQCDSLQTVLVAFSGADEYVANHVDTETLTQRLCDAMNHHRLKDDAPPVAIPFYIPTGNHNLSESKGDATRFVDKVVELLHNVVSS